jgi:hypothetical protein
MLVRINLKLLIFYMSFVRFRCQEYITFYVLFCLHSPGGLIQNILHIPTMMHKNERDNPAELILVRPGK